MARRTGQERFAQTKPRLKTVLVADPVVASQVSCVPGVDSEMDP
jgi:hypothetical protein